MDIKNVSQVAVIRHAQFMGESYDNIDQDVKRGYMIGYQQAINDLSQQLNIPLKDLLIELKRIC